mmetsp:Transcript_63847/g.152276  ORF Transcript_63847/g.152276 Transcript_63847/m.152276 type:complete len:229 (-) Transcript_63847:95-781(-)
MGYGATRKHALLGARRKGRLWAFRSFAPAFRQWNTQKSLVDKLILHQRLELTVPKAKELQQYAEEVIFLAKKNTAYHDGLVESMVLSPEARQILYERLVPRYQDRDFHFTRIVNQYTFRMRDSAKMAFIEYIDRPGELRPARPVGDERVQFVADEFLATRRGRRKHINEMCRYLGRSELPLDEATVEQCEREVVKLKGSEAVAKRLTESAELEASQLPPAEEQAVIVE